MYLFQLRNPGKRYLFGQKAGFLFIERVWSPCIGLGQIGFSNGVIKIYNCFSFIWEEIFQLGAMSDKRVFK